MTKCNKSKCIISVIAVFIFMFVYDMVVHGNLLAGAYAATASMWRPEAEMQSMWWMCIAYHAGLAVLFSALYKKTNCACSAVACSTDNKKKTKEVSCSAPCPIKNGLCFGVIIGLIMAVINGSAYMHLPMPSSLAISWFFASLFQGVGVGLVLSLINKKKDCA